MSQRLGQLMLLGMLLGMASATNNTLAFQGNEYLNGIPERFDETQLWRVHNMSDAMLQSIPVGQVLEEKFGGNIWKENSKFLDVSIGKEHVKAARSFLQAHRLDAEVLSDNVQSLIDQELLEGIQATQAQPGARSKKASRSGSGMHWKDYHDLETIYAFMREIRAKYPNICRLYTIGQTAEKRDLKVLRFVKRKYEMSSEYRRLNTLPSKTLKI